MLAPDPRALVRAQRLSDCCSSGRGAGCAIAPPREGVTWWTLVWWFANECLRNYLHGCSLRSAVPLSYFTALTLEQWNK
jgi:hypothetical protein